MTADEFRDLVDRNGVEIYEGDFLTWSTNENPNIKSAPLVVEFKHGGFGYEYYGFIMLGGNSNFQFNPYDTDNRFEILGNIYDNPGLIKQNQDV